MLNHTISWGPVPIRVIIGFGFIYHGFVKLFTTVGHENFLRLLEDINVPLPVFFSWAIGILEFLGGFALMLGIFITIFSIPLIINMIVAMFWVNLPNGFDLMNATIMIEAGPKFGIPGFEINLLYIAGLVSLLFTGAGNFALDKLMKVKDRKLSVDTSS